MHHCTCCPSQMQHVSMESFEADLSRNDDNSQNDLLVDVEDVDGEEETSDDDDGKDWVDGGKFPFYEV